jgi:hypothetical protein
MKFVRSEKDSSPTANLLSKYWGRVTDADLQDCRDYARDYLDIGVSGTTILPVIRRTSEGRIVETYSMIVGHGLGQIRMCELDYDPLTHTLKITEGWPDTAHPYIPESYSPRRFREERR